MSTLPEDLTSVSTGHIGDHNEIHTIINDGIVMAVYGGKETVQAHGNMGSTETFDLTNGNVHTGTLDASCTFTFSGTTASVACTMTLIITQNGTGGWAITWPAAVKWPGGVIPSTNTNASKVSMWTFITVDNGTTWYGFQAGDDLR